MDWLKLLQRLPDRLHDAALWLADFPLVTWLSSFNPVDFLTEALGVSIRSRAGAFAAQIAFYILMSIFPLTVLLLQLLRAAPISQESLVFAVDAMLPGYLVTPLHAILQEVFSTSFGLVPITVITMLWTTSKVMHAMVAGLDLICTTDGSRNWVVVRAWSIFCTALLVVVALALAGSTVVWQPLREMLLRNRPRGVPLSLFSKVIRLVYTLGVGTLALSVLYKILPRRHLSFVGQIPGALVATIAIYVFSAAIAIYVGHFNGFSAYGSLTTLTLIMFWLYFSCYFIMLGAVINEVMQTRRARRTEVLMPGAEKL